MIQEQHIRRIGNAVKVTIDDQHAEIEFGLFRTNDSFVELPTVMFSVWKPSYSYMKLPWIKVGRLYKGYVGLYLITNRFEVNVWIHNMEKSDHH